MAAQLQISGVTYVMIEDKFDLTNTVDERQRFQCDVQDYTNSHFTKGATVVVTDPVLGVLFNGVLNTDKEVPNYPSGYIVHSIDCIDDGQYAAGKRTYTRVYATPTLAGKIVVDQLHDVMASEGINTNYAEHFDSLVSDFNTGILSNTIGTANVGGGDLELTPSGSAVTITENTTATFAAGTLTNVVATSNTLIPITESAISLQATLALSAFNNLIYMNIWSGSMVVASNDTLHYEMWISGSNPAQSAGVDLYFSDTTSMSTTNLTDSNGVSASPWNPVPNATNTWYVRNVALTGLNGKTISNVQVAIDGNAGTLNTGTYQVYFRNIYLASQSGSPFFSTTATSTQMVPAVSTNAPNTIFGFSANVTTVTVVQAILGTTCSRVSPAYSIGAVQLLKTGTITWTETTPTNTSVSVNVTYDGGASYHPCANQSYLPALPAGSIVTGLNINIQEIFNFTGTDPTVIPSLSSVVIAMQSAPFSSKSDLLTSYTNQTAWNTGTKSNTTANSDGTLTLTNLSRNWNDTLITSQTLFSGTGTTVTQSAASGAYAMVVPSGGSGAHYDGKSRLDFLGSVQNFTLDVDITYDANSETGITYRQTYWGTGVNTFAYLVFMDQSQGIQLGYGSNSSTGAYTVLATASQSFVANTTYHLTIVVSGNIHLVYFNHAVTPAINVVDSTYTAAGNIGFRQYNYDPSTSRRSTWDNLVVVQVYQGTWTSPSTSLTSLSTYGNSVVSWTETNTNAAIGSTITVQASIDGGTTYKTCANGAAIPNFTAAQSLSGVSIKFLVTINTTLGISIPSISGFTFRVLGNYGTISGTRSTVPIGNDAQPITRTVGSGFGTAFDGQSYTQVGTATTSVSSGEMNIANTTGDVHMVLGSRTWTDEDGTVRFSLPNSSYSGGIELRYVDVNNHYRLSTTTNTITITKVSAGVASILATASVSLTANSWYRMRFRVVGSGPISLYGRVWQDQTVENQTVWTITAFD